MQTPGLNICEGEKLFMSLKAFVSNIREESDQKLNEYEERARKLSTSVEKDYSDLKKRRIASNFSNNSTEKVLLNGAEKF